MASKKKFDYQLGADVHLVSGERGKIISRSHSLEADPQYLVRYIAADRRLTESWWSEAAIQGLANPE